jgi:16S rRNA (cytidine1402-2'-O)-methyltransferase
MSADLLAQAAAQAAGAQQYPAGALYVVATPIGNLADLSLRAVHVLGLVDAIACEDTRTTAPLLRHLGLHKPLLAVHEHNEREAVDGIAQRLQRGERIALVSDAGTPAVSDPGARLVAGLQAAGCRCVPIPGASSSVTALSVAGDAHAQGFRFVGFVPPKGEARRAAVQALAGQPDSQVLFEAPHRVADLIGLLAEAAPAQRLTVAREITKQFESIHTAPCADWPARLKVDANAERGEFVLVLHAAPPAVAEGGLPAEALRVLQALTAELPLKQAVGLAAQLSGAPRNALYQQALAWRQAGDDDPAE